MSYHDLLILIAAVAVIAFVVGARFGLWLADE